MFINIVKNMETMAYLFIIIIDNNMLGMFIWVNKEMHLNIYPRGLSFKLPGECPFRMYVFSFIFLLLNLITTQEKGGTQ